MFKRIAITLVLALAIAAVPLFGQRGAGAGIKRMPDGKPDLQGVWISGGFQIDGNNPPPRSNVTLPPREAPPYKPEAAEKQRQLASSNANDPAVRCLLLGVPRSNTWPFPLEIVQQADKVVILYEAMGAWRHIPIGKPHPDDIDPSFMGTSVARWEGDVLVVDTLGFNDVTWLSTPGSHHSEELKVTERYWLTPENTLRYEAVATDPVVFTKPWTVVNLNYRHFPNASERLREYECNEDNQDLQHIVPATPR